MTPVARAEPAGDERRGRRCGRWASYCFQGRAQALPIVGMWIASAVVVGYAMAVLTYFVRRGHRWARSALVVLTGAALAIDLPLCWLMLGGDGLVRDGGPLVATAGLAVYGLWRGGIPARNMQA